MGLFQLFVLRYSLQNKKRYKDCFLAVIVCQRLVENAISKCISEKKTKLSVANKITMHSVIHKNIKV